MARIRDGPSQPVEFGHDQYVALAHGGEGLVEAGADVSCADEAEIGVDAMSREAQLLALGFHILPVGGKACVSDECCRHGGSIRIRSRMSGLNLMAAIVIYWTTARLGEGARQRKDAGLTVDPKRMAHISPLGWAHILVIGEYRGPKRR